MKYLYFILVLGGGEDPVMVNAKAESCQAAIQIVSDSLTDGYFPLGECLGITDIELYTLSLTTEAI